MGWREVEFRRGKVGDRQSSGRIQLGIVNLRRSRLGKGLSWVE